MKGISIIERGRQTVITGVEGAGRKSFASLYFPMAALSEKPIRLSMKIKEVVVVVVLDSCHLQNQAEEDLLQGVAKTLKQWKRKTIRVLLVLGRADLVCNRLQNREWVENVMREYRPFLKKLKAKATAIIAHSNLAVRRLRETLEGEVDVDDVDDLNYLLSKVGRRLPKFVSSGNVKKYIDSHGRSLQLLTGEYFAKNFLARNVTQKSQKEK